MENMGKGLTDSLANNTPNASKNFSPICLLKPKRLGFFKKALAECPWSVSSKKWSFANCLAIFLSVVRVLWEETWENWGFFSQNPNFSCAPIENFVFRWWEKQPPYLHVTNYSTHSERGWIFQRYVFGFFALCNKTNQM